MQHNRNDENYGSVVIEVKNASKSFGNRVVLKDISFSVREGQVLGLVGRNGSGKTVLLKLLAGMMSVSEGQILINGKQVNEETVFEKKMGIIIENPGFYEEFNGKSNLEYLLRLSGKYERGKAEHYMKLVGLDPRDKKRVGKYSLGMKQRLGIAQAIMEDPQIVLLDEPTNGLDNSGVKKVREILNNMKKKGTVIVVASHNREDIAALCTDVLELDCGCIVGYKRLEGTNEATK